MGPPEGGQRHRLRIGMPSGCPPLSMFERSEIHPITGGETASPNRWITRMLMANAVARIDGCVTFARMVLLGPVLKKRQNSHRKMNTHASGNGVYSIRTRNGKPA